MGVKIKIDYKQVSSNPKEQQDAEARQLDVCMKKHKKMCDKDNVTRDFKKHEYYEKPSDQRKRREAREKSNARRKVREAERESF